MISRGGLSVELNPSAGSDLAGSVTFNRDDNSIEGNAKPTDRAMVLVYNSSRNEAVFVTDGSLRSAGTHSNSTKHLFR